MARFRHYKNHHNTNSSDTVSQWENSYSGHKLNRIPNKTIIRTFINYLKYGSKSKEIFV